MPSRIIAIGDEFGRLTVIGPKYRGEGKSRNRYFIRVRCACGTEKPVNAVDMTGGKIVSCGCLFKEVHSKLCTERNYEHGHSSKPEFRIWLTIQQRCNDPYCTAYQWYGARGIKLSQEFQDSFQAFYEHVGPRPSPQHSIDRMNNDLGYVRGNLRWATAKEQACNRRPRARRSPLVSDAVERQLV